MPAPSTADEYIALVTKSELVPPDQVKQFLARRVAEKPLPAEALKLAQFMVHDGVLTKYQAEQLLGGRWRNFVIGGKYKLLERLGKGGMALVFLCEHQVMKRLVALKILPSAHATDRELLGRFHREARALSQLRHPNIVGAYDVDHANKVHFLVMEYVDGGDLDLIVQRSGPMPYERAANYIRQAAHGLQHAHECGLVHRDIKPGNLLVDRSGTVKLLDLGLARIFHESTDDLTTGRDARTLLGTVDYLAPEQALNSHDVDIRADIYGLGATFYYILTGKGLFEDGTVAQKLSWHLHRPPVSLAEARPDVPPELIQVIEKMLAKKADDRYQTPEEVDEALAPWTRSPIAPPSPTELPQLSLAARGSGQPSGIQRIPSPPSRILPGTDPRIVGSKPSKVTRILPAEDDAPAGPNPSIQVPPRPAPPALPPRGSTEIGRVPARRKPRPILAASLLGGLLAVGLAGLWASWGPLGAGPSGGSSGPSDARVAPGSSGSKPPGNLAQAPAADMAPDATSWMVAGSATPKGFPTLREAIRASKAGGRVEVRGRLLVEAVEISDVDGIPKDLTIEGVGDPPGSLVRWRAPGDLSQGRALLEISGLEGVRIKGFHFDGQGRVPELIRLAGRAAGSTLEGLEVEGATKAGIVLRGWAGEPSRPARLEGVRFATDREIEAALLIDSDRDRPSSASESIQVASCRFVGPFQAALLLAAPVSGLEVEQSRFLRATDGIRYRKADSRPPIRARIANNVFADLQRGIHFETTPEAGPSTLVVENNLFANTPRLATLDKVSVQPSSPEGDWIWTDEGNKSAVVSPGTRYFRKTFDVTSVPEKATLDISCDESFVAWLNGSEVGREPSPHYTQRVHSIDLSGRLRRGRNVLAVQGTNLPDRLDPRFGTTAGLLAVVAASGAARPVVLARTDETWKWSDRAPDPWARPEFDDRSWRTSRAWPENTATWPWVHAVWDSTIQAQLKPPLEPIKVMASGNVRDYKSWEGYPTLDAERLVIQDTALSRDPGDDAAFLRLPASNPMKTAGPGGSPIGLFRAR